MIGQIEGDAKITYTTENGEHKLYKFVLRVPRLNRRSTNENHEGKHHDFINVKCWSSKIEDEDNLHDQAFVGIEGRLQSYGGNDHKIYGNEVIATKILYLE